MKIRTYIYLALIGLLTPIMLGAQSTDQNYISTRTYQNDSSTVYLDAIQYFDGLGRLVQSVQRGVTPSKQDLVSIQEYDSFGRESNTWLPGISSTNGAFVAPEGLKNTIKSSPLYGNDQNPFSQPVYEASPLNRVLKQFGPGQEWQSKGKAINTGYLTNATNVDTLNCKYYTIEDVDNQLLLKLTYIKNYNTGELYVTRIEDEEGNTSLEFKDKLGQVVLMRQIIRKGNIKDLHDTYYVYDDFGNLRCVIPPITAQTIRDFSEGESRLSSTSPHMRLYCYLYKYDNRNRCIAKKLPGCDWIYYVYDKADQLIFSQDGEQRIKKEWLFSIPDAFGRPVLSGVCKDTLNIHNTVVRADYTGSGTYKGYTLSINGLNQYSLLTVNYYDNYEFVGKNSFPNFAYDPGKETEGFGKRYNESKGYEAKTLLTGTITSTFGTEGNTVLYSIMYYDNRQRLIQTQTSNHLDGVDVEYFAYNFTGNPTMKLHLHIVGLKEIKELYTYSYDHAGRLIETHHKIGKLGTMLLCKNSYDELGRLQSQTKGYEKP